VAVYFRFRSRVLPVCIVVVVDGFVDISALTLVSLDVLPFYAAAMLTLFSGRLQLGLNCIELQIILGGQNKRPRV